MLFSEHRSREESRAHALVRTGAQRASVPAPGRLTHCRDAAFLPIHLGADTLEVLELGLGHILRSLRFQDCLHTRFVRQFAEWRAILAQVLQIENAKTITQPSPEALNGIEIWAAMEDVEELHATRGVDGPA